MSKVFFAIGTSLDGYLAGLVDEFTVHLAPIVLGKGVRLFDLLEKGKFSVEIEGVINSPQVTHLKYRVINEK